MAGEAGVLRAERRLEDVNEAIAQVLDGSAPEPRLVFDMTPVAEVGSSPVAATVEA